MKTIVVVAAAFMVLGSTLVSFSQQPAWFKDTAIKIEADFGSNLNADQKQRLHGGMEQAANLWRDADGDRAVFEDFVKKNFAAEQTTLDSLFDRFESNLEMLDGHYGEIGRVFRAQAELDLGPILPFDEVFAAYDPWAHYQDDFFDNKLAFVVLLNFPLTTLDERVKGDNWTRRQWAEARLARRFSRRVPADVNLAFSRAAAAADAYIADFNIWMHHLIDAKGERLFAPKMRLLSHWNLRDELKADYGDKKNGLAKQRVIQQVMERIVTQTIPAVVINNPQFDWDPFTNQVKAATVNDSEAPIAKTVPPMSAAEPNTRYERWLANFRAARLADQYSPQTPTFIRRSFEDSREIPEARVEAMFKRVLTSPLIARTAKQIESRLGRQLEPFDIWYNGFRTRPAMTDKELDDIVAKKYPNAAAFEKDIPNILIKLGFSPERAQFVANNIVVDPARGSGHALGAGMRSAKTHLRTRVGKNGMDYKGYNIAVHELGHNVEQTFSMNKIDHTLLNGVPNNAFTEALAFVFQHRDLELLGLPKPTEEEKSLRALDDLWMTYEIAGVALVDMGVWHWMYDHPNATAAELKGAVVMISKDVWNKYYAGVFGKRDVVLLGIYSHMINNQLYLPDYPIGHMIAFQIEEQMGDGPIGEKFEQVARIGNVSPDVWMKKATGAPVGPEALLRAAEQALSRR
jgi:hypothetical protein